MMPNSVATRNMGPAFLPIAHFARFALQTGRGIPAIEQGHYVTESNGMIFEVLTQAQYFHLNADRLRIEACIFLFVFFGPAAHWWFSTTNANET
jgi:hypothetical protein